MKTIESVKGVQGQGGLSFFTKIPGDTPVWNPLIIKRLPQWDSDMLLGAKLLEVLFEMFPNKLE
jgi:hypothetical protein